MNVLALWGLFSIPTVGPALLWAIRGQCPNVVYYLTRGVDDDNPKAAGWVGYVGSSTDWDSRREHHTDDRDADWAPWKASIDWPISGPVLTTLTEGGARRCERRRIRTLTYAARIGCVPPIENKLDTNLSRGPHPIRWLHWHYLMAESMLTRRRRLHMTPNPFPLPWPPPAVDLDGRTIIDVEEAERTGRTAPDRSTASPAPGGEAAPAPAAPVEQPAEADPDPAVSPEVPQPVSLSHTGRPVSLSHCVTGPRRGPARETPSETPERETALPDETPEGDMAGAGAVEPVLAEIGVSGAASPPRAGRGVKRAAGAGRESSGGVDRRQIRARQLRERGLSYGEIVLQLEADGDTVSRATVARWCKG